MRVARSRSFLSPVMSAVAVLTMGAALGTAQARDLVVALKTEPTSMDPQYHALTPNIQLSQTLFEALVCGDADLVPKPCIAESWKADGKVWTFKLRPNVKFSDGSPLTAQDVVFTLDRAPKVPNSPSSFKVYLQKVEKVEAVDPLTVRITTTEPYPLLAGDVDLIEDPPTDDLERLKKDPKLRIETKASNRIIYVALDQNGPQTPGISDTGGKNPLLDKRVREALSLAVDRDALVARTMGGVATPAAQLLPFPMFGASDKLTKAPKADPEKAKALLKEAGYPNGFTMVLGTPNGRYINDSKVAQTLAAMWTRVGVKTSIDANAPAVFFKNRDSYVYSAYLAGWGTATGEMSNTLNSLLVTPNKDKGVGTTNRSRYSNPEMDKLVESSAAMMNDGARAAALARASEIAMADFAMLPIHFEHSVWAMKKNVKFQGRADQQTMVQYATPAN